MGNLISLESNTSNALDMTGGDINVKQKLTVSGETVFNKNITLNPNVLINNIDLATVNKDVTALKASGGLVGNFGTNDLSAGNITSSKLLKTSSINVDGDVTSKYISGNATEGLKISNGTSNITYDTSGVINFNNNNKVNFGPVQISGAGIIKGTSDKAFITAASNDTNNLFYIAPRNTANTDFDYTKQFQMNKAGDVVVNGTLTANNGVKVGTVSLDNTGVKVGSVSLDSTGVKVGSTSFDNTLLKTTNVIANTVTSNSNTINSSGGTFASPGTSGLLISGAKNNWLFSELEGSISKTKRLCLSLDNKPLVCINPVTKNLMDGSKDW